jgi:hypothetical protein
VTTAGRGWGSVIALTVVVACGGADAPIEGRSELADLLPAASSLAGWVVSEGPIEHTSATLYEYLDGGADRYLTHGFRVLLHLRYQLGADPLACVTLDIYDLGSDLGAFGIYSAARPPEVGARPWGTEGYRVGTIAAAWKGSLYVHAEADDDRPELIAMLERLVAGICERAAGGRSLPSVLAPLPVDGRVAQSERYVPDHLLGHSFLSGGVLATYEVERQRAELYLSDLGSEAAASEALEALRSHLSQWGAVEGEVTSLGGGGFRYSEPTLGAGTVVRTGSHVAGIHGELGLEAREAVLDALLEALP